MKKGLSGLAALFGKKGRREPEADPQSGIQSREPDPPVRFWEEPDPPYQITLTDVRAVDRYYRHVIEASLLVGFSSEMDVCVNHDKSVSRRHCELLRAGDCFYIVNHSQSNGTYLNHQAVTAMTPMFDGDIITMGRVELRLEIDG